jgi:hypothetical protein
MLAELLAANRRLIEDLLLRVRRMESSGPNASAALAGDVQSTGHASWKASTKPPT